MITAGETKIIGLLSDIKEEHVKNNVLMSQLNQNINKLFSLLNQYNSEYQEMINEDLKPTPNSDVGFLD